MLEHLDIKGQITIKLGDQAESEKLNTLHRKKNYPTDVLSFPIEEEFPEGYYLGDIFICYPIAIQQARENNISAEEELIRLMIHGILHLAGFDHEKDSGEMLKKQEQIFEQIRDAR